MGADWYDFICYTVAGIPVPKEALLQPFELQGFKLITVHHEHDDEEQDECRDEYHGAMICLASTELIPSPIEAIGSYEIERYEVRCWRVRHLDVFMPADTKESLVKAFETYTGRKPAVVPGFWSLSASSEYFIKIHTTWSLGEGSILGKDCDYLCYSVDDIDDA
ncbi:MAG: hypothetical protein J3Q66DRAFT_332687 [Benniella sp.]|nr:MAG: hypothetical protein J3Q66DRAFT_332687 [Benniella sp.]